MIPDINKQKIKSLSYDNNLFRKEVIKTLLWTKANEKPELKNWLLNTFGNTHGFLINKIFEVARV